MPKLTFNTISATWLQHFPSQLLKSQEKARKRHVYQNIKSWLTAVLYRMQVDLQPNKSIFSNKDSVFF